MLYRKFDSGTLAGLRAAVLGYVTDCGMPGDRAIEVMLAVHELAANAVRHGPGHGRLRINVTASTLRCEVSDVGSRGRDGHLAGVPGAVPWPVEQDHGLYVVCETADRFGATSGPRGSLATAEFSLSAATPPAAGVADASSAQRSSSGTAPRLTAAESPTAPVRPFPLPLDPGIDTDPGPG